MPSNGRSLEEEEKYFDISAIITYAHALLALLLTLYIVQCLQWVYFVLSVWYTGFNDTI
jgi:hypothetical protein